MSDTESFESAMDFANTVVADCDIPLLDRLQSAHDREIDELRETYERERGAARMSKTESFESVAKSYDNYTWIGRDGVKRAIDRLRAAHDREIEQARDPQRIGGRLERGSFEYAIEQLREFRWQHATNDEDAIPYINGVAKAHAQSLKREYHRGFEDGRHSMDAEHRTIAMRLRALPMNRVEYGSNLHDIIEAVCGTNKAGDIDLRDKLIDLMGGVSDDISESITTDELIEYINQDTRRLKSDASKAGDDSDTCACTGGGACAADDCDCAGEQAEVGDDGADGGACDNVANGDACDADARGHAVGRDFHGLVVSDGRTDNSCIRSHLLSSASRNDVCTCRDSGEQEESDGRYELLLDGSISGSLNPDWHRAGKDGILSDERLADDSAADFRGGSGSDVVHLDGLATYDVLWNERCKAVCELRKLTIGSDYHDDYQKIALAIGAMYDGKSFMSECVRDRLIHLLGGDQPSGIDVLREMDAESDADGTCPNDVPTSSITDGLRKWASDRHCKGMSHTDVLNIGLIADRIDEQFDRICQQQEAVLQSTIDNMVKEYEHDRLPDQLRIEKLEKQCDELVDLLRDAREEYKTLDQMSAETSTNFHAMRDRAWCLEAERDELQAKLEKTKELLEVSYGKQRAYKTHIAQMDGGSKRLREEVKSLKRAAERDADQMEALSAALDDMTMERDELRRKVDELESFDLKMSIAAFGDDNGKLRRMLSMAATLLANAEQDRDANYAYWMDCKEKVVHANATIEELQAKLDAIRDALDG